MAKNSVRDFDATAANNTDIQSVDIAENCAPSGINNAIRELMADIKDVSAGTVALESPQADSMTVTGDLTGVNATFTTADNTDNLTLTSTDADANSGPNVKLYRNSASPADGDALGFINFYGENDADEETLYGQIRASIADASDGTEDARFIIQTAVAGTQQTSRLELTGTETVINEDSKDLDFRVESDNNANALFVQGSDGFVGVNESGPTVPLEVKGAQGYASSASNLLTSTTKAAAKIRGSNDASASLFFGSLTNDAEQYIQSCNGAGDGADDIVLNPFGGNVGIGTPPLKELHLHTQVGSTGDVEMLMDTGSGSSAGQDAIINSYRSNADLILKTNNAERMRIDSSGNLFVGTTSSPITSNKGTALAPSSLDRTLILMSSSSVSNGVELIKFRNPNGEVGTISTNASSTSYNTSSDYRLKENVTNITDGIERVKQLNPSRFNFIADADTTVDGFLAHEVSGIVPEAITGEKDAMMDEEYIATPATGEIYTPAQEATYDADGNELTAATNEVVHSTDVEKPDTLEEGRKWRETTKAIMGTRTVPNYQCIDQSKLVPLLTAALQEAVAKIEALETRVATLEG